MKNLKLVVLGEYGFMVLVWLRGLREIYTKIPYFREIFRRANPALTKSNPKVFAQYLRRAVENILSVNQLPSPDLFAL